MLDNMLSMLVQGSTESGCVAESPLIGSLCAEIPSLVLLTKIDAYDPDVIGANLSQTFHSERLLQLVEVSSIL